jgi:hypothetical protein
MGLLDDLSWRKELDDLEAINQYMMGLRKEIPKYPELEGHIKSWEAWHGALTTYEKSPLAINDTMAEAKRRRKVANEIADRKLPPDYIPADSPQEPPEEKASIEDNVMTGLKLVGGLAIGYLLLKAFL